MFTACLYVFLACPAEMLPTLRLKTGILPILMRSVSQISYVYDRTVCFQVWSVCVDSLSGGRVLILNQERMASSSSVTNKP